MYDLTQCSHCREAYGKTLVDLGIENSRIVVLDSDIRASTKTKYFADKFPDRFFDIGIAEQNLMGVAAGFALSGKIPFLSTFAIFGTGRGWEQIRNMIAFDNLTVNLVMTHAGFSLGGDGATHQSLEDVAIMRVIPNMQVIIPADWRETESVIRYAAEKPGPKYVRLSRRRTLEVNTEGYQYKPTEYPILEDGSDVTIFTNGCMIRESLIACYTLRTLGISVRVVNVHTVKPLHISVIVKHAQETGYVITAEEHSIIGGLGSAVAEVLSEHYPIPMARVGVPDRYGGSGTCDELMVKCEISSDHIIGKIRNLLKR
jgi:transketolase